MAGSPYSLVVKGEITGGQVVYSNTFIVNVDNECYDATLSASTISNEVYIIKSSSPTSLVINLAVFTPSVSTCLFSKNLVCTSGCASSLPAPFTFSSTS